PADLLVADQLHLGRLHHRVRGLHHPHEALGLDQPQRVSHAIPLSSPKHEDYLSLKGAFSLPEIDFSAATAASDAESMSASLPHMYNRPKAPKGVTSTSRTLAAFSASLAASAA